MDVFRYAQGKQPSLYCSNLNTPDDEQIYAQDIHKMHLGFGWDGIGYHKLYAVTARSKMEDLNIGWGHMSKVTMKPALVSVLSDELHSLKRNLYH